jgi:hypothetical protein
MEHKKKIEKEEDAGIHDVLTDVYSCRPAEKKKEKKTKEANKETKIHLSRLPCHMT